MNTVTKDGIKARIVRIEYFVLPKSTVTLCSITLDNGFSVRGESACVDPDLFDKDLGEKLAYEQAFNKLWAFEGYLLAEKLYQQSKGI